MARPLIIDTFPFRDEFDLLECRLVELYDAVDWFVAVEADVDHQDHPKPYYLTENLDRFAPFKDKLIVVRASGLPTAEEDDDPWARELSQREFIREAFDTIRPDDQDILLHGDVDEIPRALFARNVRPQGTTFVSFDQVMYSMAVDWQHPDPWRGTVAARVAGWRTNAGHSFAKMRDTRNRNTTWLPDSGWHLTWLGGKDEALRKLGAFCHPEIADRTLTGLTDGIFLRDGWHVDGRKLTPVDVDETWPRWIVEGHAPAAWFRPR